MKRPKNQLVFRKKTKKARLRIFPRQTGNPAVSRAVPSRPVCPDEKKRVRANKMPVYFGFGIAFSEKRGIFCDDLFSFNINFPLPNERN